MLIDNNKYFTKNCENCMDNTTFIHLTQILGTNVYRDMIISREFILFHEAVYINFMFKMYQMFKYDMSKSYAKERYLNEDDQGFTVTIKGFFIS